MKFQIGDRVRIINPGNSYKNPEELKVIGLVGIVTGVFPGWGIGPACALDILAGRKYWQVAEIALELVPPDREQTLPWSQCVWKPAELRV